MSNIQFLNYKVEMYEGCTGSVYTSPLQEIQLDKNVKQAEVVLKGFALSFANSEHPINLISVDIVDVSFDDQTKKVRFRTNLAMKDNTGNFDDGYYGSVEVLVIGAN
jgi:hypothetical protein